MSPRPVWWRHVPHVGRPYFADRAGAVLWWWPSLAAAVRVHVAWEHELGGRVAAAITSQDLEDVR